MVSHPPIAQSRPQNRMTGEWRLLAAALSVRRGDRLLFEGLEFEGGRGDYIELHGANGAGKTSLLRVMAGFSRPAAGAVSFQGLPEPMSEIHFVGHHNGLKGSESVRAHVQFWRCLFDSTGGVDGAIASVGLSKQANLPARVLSQGQARRLALSRLVIAPRQIWLLDEPAAALDAEGRAIVASLVDSHRERGGLVIAAVHEALGPRPSRTLQIGGPS